MMTEAQIKAALDGNFYAINFNTGRVIGMTVAHDYMPTHTPLFSDFVSDAPPVKDEEAKPPLERDPKLNEILYAVCAVTRIGRRDITSPRRAPQIVEARQMYFWFARYYTGASFPMIGMMCDGKDHATVVHGVRKIDKNYDRFLPKLEAIARRLGVALDDRMRVAA